MNRFSLLFLTLFFSFSVKAQVDKNQLGAWYMLFLDGKFSETSNVGFESDIQHRNFDAGRDLEQLMLRGGLSYKFPETKTKLTLGYAHIISSTFGMDDNSKSYESRVYQQLIFSNKLFSRVYVMQRFRYEQRFVQNQDFRTRWRHFFAVNIPLNELTDPAKMALMEETQNIYIHCAAGYRSMIATSLIKRQGIHNLRNVVGGWNQIKELEKVEIIKEKSILN